MTEPDPSHSNRMLLLLDTCGDLGSVALVGERDPAEPTAEELWLGERTASTALLQAVRELLRRADLRPRELGAVGVVAGPGSFTGVRVGMAVAKGLCEAAALRLVAVSRLAVLAGAADLADGFAVLRAGRDQVYVREQGKEGPSSERLLDLSTLLSLARGRAVIYAEPALETALKPFTAARYVGISARSARSLVIEALAEGQTELAYAEANYVRDEGSIYRLGLAKRAGP